MRQRLLASISLSILLSLTTSSLVFADEGMWPPEQLPELAKELNAYGLEIDTESLTDLTAYPMNAVISLGGCTASFVSPQGLVVTNHHCAYGSIQYNSTAENNLLEDGFLAQSLDEELRASPGSRVYVTVEFKDVTDTVLAEAKGMQGLARYEAIDRREKELVAQCEEDGGYRCKVSSYYGGLRFSLIKQMEIRDVRLVYAPPSGIGKFGGDIDNWMWPRHTGDYSFYRAYVGPDGKPTDYSDKNVPYKPKHFLKVSTEGVKEGDLVLVAGYPGSTNRYRLASEVEEVFSWWYPTRIEAYQQWLDIVTETVKGRPDAAIKYASLDASLNNSLKNNRGMLDGFAKTSMLEEKKQLEHDLLEWISASSNRRNSYGKSIVRLKTQLEKLRLNRERDMYRDMILRSNVLSAARRTYRLAKEKEKPNMERESGYQERDIPSIRQRHEAMERRYDPEVDKAFLSHFLAVYNEKVKKGRMTALDEWFDLMPGKNVSKSVSKRLAKMYSETKLGETDVRLRLLEASAKELESSTDPFIQLAVHLYDDDITLEKEEKEAVGDLQQLRSQYMEALIAFLKTRGKAVYPDANSTLRVTYGTVKGYNPADAVSYRPFTAIQGILDKETGVEPFNTSKEALEAMRAGDWGRYTLPPINSVPVNFLTTCDSTGGNSGSATLNAKGELVGLLFDGNYESMIADWDFIPEITRSIHVDMRYVLWLMEKVDQADRLLEEMGVL